MRRVLAIALKEFRQIRRDPLLLGMLVFIPALLLAMYGYALSFDVKHIRIAVCDEDNTAESRAFLDGMFRNPYFDRVATLSSMREADSLLVREKARAVVAIGKGYARRLARGENAPIQVLVDGANANSGLTLVGYIESLADRVTRDLRLRTLARRGGPGSLPVVTPEPRIWFNPALSSARFLVPGLSGMLLMLSAVIATSQSIVRERERQTMDQMRVSPVRPWEIILGKTFPYVLICLITMGMILLLGRLLFGVEVRGSWRLLSLATFVFLFAALGMGVLISSATRSQAMAFQVAILSSLLPSIVLSGFIFPIRSMPAVLQVATLLVVPRHFVSALRAIILKGASFADVAPQLGAMLALGVLFNGLALRNTRKKT